MSTAIEYNNTGIYEMSHTTLSVIHLHSMTLSIFFIYFLVHELEQFYTVKGLVSSTRTLLLANIELANTSTEIFQTAHNTKGISYRVSELVLCDYYYYYVFTAIQFY